MVGIGDRNLVACTRAGSPSCRAAADAGGCSRHDCASGCRCRGHQRQAPAAAPEPPAAGRLAPAAAARLCRPETSPVRPATVRAGSRTCRTRRLVVAGTGSNWLPEWLLEPVRRVRIISLNWSPVTESNRRPSPYHACRFRLMASGWVGLPQVGQIAVSEHVALCLPSPSALTTNVHRIG